MPWLCITCNSAVYAVSDQKLYATIPIVGIPLHQEDPCTYLCEQQILFATSSYGEFHCALHLGCTLRLVYDSARSKSVGWMVLTLCM